MMENVEDRRFDAGLTAGASPPSKYFSALSNSPFLFWLTGVDYFLLIFLTSSNNVSVDRRSFSVLPGRVLRKRTTPSLSTMM